MEAPLVNEYKKNFLLRRLLTTFLGGLRIYFAVSVPIYIYLIQIIMFIFIPCMCGIFLYLLDKAVVDSVVYAAVANGCTTLVYSLFIQLLALCLQRQNTEKENEQVDSFGDEEVFTFDSIFGPKTWLFLVPPKKSLISIVINSLTAGVVGGLAVYYLHLEPKEYLLWNIGLQWGFMVLGLFTLTVGIWPLIVGSTPEPALFHQLPYDLQDLSRPIHMLTFIMIHAIASPHRKDSWLFYADCFAHVLFAFSSVLWLIGALPPIDAYVLWGLEQWLTVFLGGTPTASNTKLILHCVVGTLSILLLAAMPNFIAMAVVSAVVGFLLSLDWDFLLSSLRGYRVRDASENVSISSSLRSRRWLHQELIFYGVFFFGVLGLSLIVHLAHHEWYKTRSKIYFEESSNITTGIVSDSPLFFEPLTINILWGCVIFLVIIMIFHYKIQKPYVFVWFRNPIYEKVKTYSPRPFYVMSQLVHCGGPLISLVLIHALMGAGSPDILDRKSYLESFCVAISFGFIFRQIWQASELTLLVLTAYIAVEKIGGELLQNSIWGEVIVSVKIHIFNLLLRWLKGTWNRCTTIIMFSLTSITEPKQRKLINYFLVGMNVGMLPILVLLACLSSVFSFPLFPLFTLPLFLMGFPRPLRFWSYPVGYSANHCSDTVYYEQLLPSVCRGLHQLSLCGSLGPVDSGDFFLLRWEDRFLWVQVLENGFGYRCYSFKGLELQETSCHTAEASRVDSIFSRAFDLNDDCFNRLSCHCLSPLTTFKVIGYSDTRNVLTGVLDSPDTLNVIKDYFNKCLLFLLLEYVHTNNDETLSLGARPASACSRPGSAEAKTLKAFATLPKAERVVGASRVSIRTTASGEETSSLKSQSGRGSRMAWVSRSKLVVRDKKEVPPPQPASIREEDKEEVVVRPASWDSQDDPLETNNVKTLNLLENFPSDFKEIEKEGRKPRTTHSSKAKSYVKVISSSSDIGSQVSGLNDISSGSDSETESTKEFFTKSIPRRPQQRRRESESFRLSENPITKIGRRVVTKNKPAYKNSLCLSFSPVKSWLANSPFDEEALEDFQDSFPLSWFRFLLKRFGIQKINQSKSLDNNGTPTSREEMLLDQLLSDENLEECYRELLAICSLTVIGSDLSYPNTSQVFKIFNGEIPNSKGREWLRAKVALQDIVLKSYRIAVKLSLDHTLVAPINNCWMDLGMTLEEYSHDWFIGPDTDGQQNDTSLNRDSLWNRAVSKELRNLFSIGYNDLKGVYTSHLLTLGEAEINIGRLDCETVRSVWASLTGELLYLTNDDDERYSIQAHPVLLRNLTIQAADPPLGYPIYSSPPMSLGPFLN